MRLLIVTQKVDEKDPVLGFFCKWLRYFSEEFPRVTVIAQQTNFPKLPGNVVVHSLKKEEGLDRVRQVLRFRTLIKQLSPEYDVVLVHMTPIWVVIGAGIWKNLKKPVYLWYESRGRKWSLKLALQSVRRVFSASKSGMPISTDKSVIVGHGIDTDYWSDVDMQRDPYELISVGRISASKRVDVIVRAFAELSPDYRLTFAGAPITDKDKKELARLRRLLQEKHLEGRVQVQYFSPFELREEARRAILLLHASVTSLDKAILEAMSCGCLVVSCSEAAKEVLPPECIATPETLGERARGLLALPPAEREVLSKRLREIVQRDHGLPRLIKKLREEMSA